MALEDLFGSPDYLRQLLGEEQFNKARQNALSQGVINASLQLLAGTPPSFDNRNATQRLIAQAGQAGLQGYQGSMDRTLSDMAKSMQIQDMLEKQKRDKRFREQIGAAYTTRPSGTGLTSTGQGSQAQMLAEQIKEFGDEGMASTVGALQSNVNLPQERVLDQRKFMSALAEYNPLEYAKMTMTGEKAPDAIRTFEAFSKMNPEQQKQFLAFKASGTPQTNISLGEKGIDKITSEAVKGYYDRAGSARQMAIASNVVADLREGQGGGKAVQIGTDLARTLGLGDKGSIASADAAAALVTQTAVKVRPEGSGSTSNIEFDAYRQSVPSLANSAQGRRLMANINTAFADRNELLADYAAQIYSQGKYSLKAMREYDQSLGAILPPNFNEQVTAITGKAPVQRRSF
jgi:hypothetical protein